MIEDDKRIRLFIGHYESGKREVFINYVTKLRKIVDGEVALDVVNVYFITRDKIQTSDEIIWYIDAIAASSKLKVTGLINPSQADYYMSTKGGGNGDYRTPVYAPASVQEAVDMIIEAFDVVYIYRTPVMVVDDGMIGQMMEPVDFDKERKIRKIPQKLGLQMEQRGKGSQM